MKGTNCTKFAVFVIIFSILANYASTLQFSVGNREKCISEDLGMDMLIIGTYEIQVPMQVKVVNPNERTIWSENYRNSGSFAFTSDTVGIHYFCFVPDANLQSSGQETMVTLDLKMGVDAKDYNAIGLKEDLSPFELELKKLLDVVSSVNSHMSYMKQREAAMRDTNESTNSRVIWLSFISLLVLVTLGVGQIFYLKRFFAAKRLI